MLTANPVARAVALNPPKRAMMISDCFIDATLRQTRNVVNAENVMVGDDKSHVESVGSTESDRPENGTGPDMSFVTARLRALRQRTGLSMREVAQRLGMKGPSSYQRYEDANLYRDQHLPLDLARKLADVFAEKGVPREETMALAGLEPGEGSDTPAPPRTELLDLVQTAVQALSEYVEESGVTLTHVEKGVMVSTFLRWYDGEVRAGRQIGPLNVERAKSLFRLLDSNRPR